MGRLTAIVLGSAAGGDYLYVVGGYIGSGQISSYNQQYHDLPCNPTPTPTP